MMMLSCEKRGNKKEETNLFHLIIKRKNLKKLFYLSLILKK